MGLAARPWNTWLANLDIDVLWVTGDDLQLGVRSFELPSEFDRSGFLLREGIEGDRAGQSRSGSYNNKAGKRPAIEASCGTNQKPKERQIRG